MNFDFNIITNSFIAGSAQTLIGHPFDTVKTNIQFSSSKSKLDIIKNIFTPTHGKTYIHVIPKLYRGFIPPLFGGCIQNSFIFTMENHIKSKISVDAFVSGTAAGGIAGMIMSPFEFVKCRLQHDDSLTMRQIFRTNNVYRGTSLILVRDSIGFGIYFKAYEVLQNYWNQPFINGGLCGVTSWLFSYPVDTLRTKYIVQHSPIQSMFSLVKTIPISSLTRGIEIMMIRAFLVNGGIFAIFESLQ